MDKNQDSKLTIKTALMNTVANIIGLVVGMVMVPIIARVLTPAELGVASTFLSTRNTVVIVITCAVYAYVNRAMLEFREHKKDYIYTMVLFCICTVIAAFLICIPFKSQLMGLFTLDGFLFYWLFGSCLVFALYSLGNYYCIFHNKSIIIFCIVLSGGVISQLLSLGLAYVMPQHRAIGRVIGLDFTYGVVAICVLIWMALTRKKTPKLLYIKQTMRFTVPVIPHLLSQMVLTQCDLIMISYYAGEDKSGIYSMGHTIGFLAFTVMTQVMAAWSPWVYRRLEEHDTGIIRQNAQVMMLLGAYMSIGLMTVGTELIHIFLTDLYLPCIYIVPPLVLAMFFQFLYLFLYDVEYYYKKAKLLAVSSVISSVLNLILNAVFIPRYSYLAACYTTVASYLALLILNYMFSRRIGTNEIYNLKLMVVLVVAVAAYMFFVFMAIQYVTLRYGVLVLITVILLAIEKEKLKRLLFSMKGQKNE